MKTTIPIALLNHYRQENTTLAYCLEVTREDLEVFRLTTHDRALEVDGETYEATTGFDVTEIVYQAGLAPDNMNVRVLYDGGSFTRASLLTGKWNNAKFRLFEVNYEDTSMGINPCIRGTFGEAKINRGEGYDIELRSLKQQLQKPIGRMTQKTCPYRVGVNNGYTSRCPVNIVDFTYTMEVTDVTSGQVFDGENLASPAVFDDEWFQEGTVTFIDGANAGYTRKVKLYAGGEFTTMLAFPFEIQDGDQFTAVAGCMKRFIEDCIGKFDVGNSFGGEPHIQGPDSLTKVPTPSS